MGNSVELTTMALGAELTVAVDIGGWAGLKT
jgi:hypothetical protein